MNPSTWPARPICLRSFSSARLQPATYSRIGSRPTESAKLKSRVSVPLQELDMKALLPLWIIGAPFLYLIVDRAIGSKAPYLRSR